MNVFSKQKTFLDFFPVPEFLLLSTAGISITDDSIKFVQFKKGKLKGEHELAHCGSEDLPQGILESGFVNDPATLASLLRQVSARYGAYYIHATLPEEKAYLFTASIERVPSEGLRDAIAFIIEENAPVTLSNCVFDFEIIGETKDKSEIKVAVSVVSAKVVSTYIEIFESAGMTPVSFDIESQAIGRAVVPCGDERTHLIINIGKRKIGFYIVENEVVKFSSTLASGSENGESNPNVSELQEEMRKLLVFWNTRLDAEGMPEKKIEKILVSGPEAANEDLVKELLGGLGLEYALADVWVNTNSFHDKVPEVPFSESLGYAAAIGVALPHKKKNYV